MASASAPAAASAAAPPAAASGGSAGYNDRLKPLAWKGECGDRETEEPRSKWSPKAVELAQWMLASKSTVVFTGAGISCASGIPDFRGPNGVWTLEKQNKKPAFDVSFEEAIPSFTHYALVALMQRGLISYVVSQNVDGLHLRSGIPRSKLSELHGNIFAEHCDRCNTEYIRPFDVKGMGFKPTGRMCENPMCGGPLRDCLADWDTKLPDKEFEPAIAAHQQADLAICLGTSLRIRPAGNMPLRTLRKHQKDAPGRLVIVNLQKTHLDRSASMRFHVRTDALMRELCQLLQVHVPQDNADAAKAASAAAAAEDAQHAAARAAAAANPRPPRKSKSKAAAAATSSSPVAVGRPTRFNTERLRQLYNPGAAQPNCEAAQSGSPPAAAPSHDYDSSAHSAAAADAFDSSSSAALPASTAASSAAAASFAATPAASQHMSIAAASPAAAGDTSSAAASSLLLSPKRPRGESSPLDGTGDGEEEAAWKRARSSAEPAANPPSSLAAALQQQQWQLQQLQAATAFPPQ